MFLPVSTYVSTLYIRPYINPKESFSHVEFRHFGIMGGSRLECGGSNLRLQIGQSRSCLYAVGPKVSIVYMLGALR